MAIVTAEKVSFQYHKALALSLTDLNFSLSAGKFVLLCGPTGSGKTSLLRVINGLIPHFYPGKYFGYLKVDKIDSCEVNPAELARHIGTVFQIPENQLFTLDVERELAFALEQRGFPQEEITRRITNVISMTGIEELRHRAPFELSGGEQQKVAIAALLALEPSILMLDEPLSNLDPHSAQEIIQMLVKIQKEHQRLILVAEHRLQYLLPVVDEILLMDMGRIIAYGSVAEILQKTLFYSSNLDIPSLQYWFFRKMQESNVSLPLPNDKDQRRKIIQQYFSAQLPHLSPSYVTPPRLLLESSHPSIIDFLNVSFYYNRDTPIDFALIHLSFSIFPGEIIGIIGKNGAGKSTLIRCINGLLRPQSGIINLFGQSIKNVPIHDLTTKVGVMFQNPDHQLFSNTVEEELRFSLRNLHLSQEEQEKRIAEVLRRLNIDELRHESPFEISGGQKKKVAMASILCRHPNVLIFDEPTIGQDAKEKAALKKIIHSATQDQQTVIIVSHDMEFLGDLVTRFIVLQQGTVYSEGKAENVFTDPKILEVAGLEPTELQQILQDIVPKVESSANYSPYFRIDLLEEVK